MTLNPDLSHSLYMLTSSLGHYISTKRHFGLAPTHPLNPSSLRPHSHSTHAHSGSSLQFITPCSLRVTSTLPIIIYHHSLSLPLLSPCSLHPGLSHSPELAHSSLTPPQPVLTPASLSLTPCSLRVITRTHPPHAHPGGSFPLTKRHSGSLNPSSLCQDHPTHLDTAKVHKKWPPTPCATFYNDVLCK